MTVAAILEPTHATEQYTDAELRQAFDECKRQYSSDFSLTLFALNLEACERIVMLEARLSLLEAKKR